MFPNMYSTSLSEETQMVKHKAAVRRVNWPPKQALTHVEQVKRRLNRGGRARSDEILPQYISLFLSRAFQALFRESHQ